MIKIPKSIYSKYQDYGDEGSKHGYIFIKYLWDIKFVIQSTKKTIVPKLINSITKVCNYDSYMFPYWSLNLNIEDIYHPLLYQHQKEVLATIKLTKCLYFQKDVTDSGGYAGAKPAHTEVVFNETFVPFFKNLNGMYLEESEEAKAGENEKDPIINEAKGTLSHNVEVEMIHLGSEDMNKKIYNILAWDCEPGDIIGLLLSEEYANVRGAIIDPPDNTNKYPYIIIPPRNLKNALKFLQLQWGIYLDTPTFFIDMGFAYVLKQGWLSHEIEKNDSDTTTVYCNYRMGTFDKFYLPNAARPVEELNNWIYNIKQPLRKKDIETQLGEILPDVAIVSNYDLSANMLDITKSAGGDKSYNVKEPVKNIAKPVKSHEYTADKITYEYDSTNNLFNTSARVRKTARKNFIGLSIGGVDMDSFAPNKKVYLNTDTDTVRSSNPYKKNYCIHSVVFNFAPVKGLDNFSLTTCTALVNLIDGLEFEENK